MRQPYVNTTLGRDFLNPKKNNNYAFIIYHDEGQIGIVTDDYYFTKNINFPDEQLVPCKIQLSLFLIPKHNGILCKKKNVCNLLQLFLKQPGIC